MHPKDADGMANSVDPDQTASSEAVCSWSALFAETYLSQYIEFVRYVKHKVNLVPLDSKDVWGVHVYYLHIYVQNCASVHLRMDMHTYAYNYLPSMYVCKAGNSDGIRHKLLYQ